MAPSGFGEISPWLPPAGFDEIKAAQISAYFAQQDDNPTDKLKIIKLVYLAEREYLDRYLLPMTFDEFWSMKDGPVASATLNGLNGKLNQTLWGEWIDHDNNKIKSHKKRKRQEFDHLSDAEIDVLESIWKKFGGLRTPEIWRYVHTKCPEYQEIKQGRLPIRYRDILRVLKKRNADEIAENIGMLRREAAFL